MEEKQDRTLKCKDCGNDFVFTAGEQTFYAEKGFENEPARCPECRKTKKQERRGFGSRPKKLFDAVCAECGQKTQVPFFPKGEKPVYCRDCFIKKK